MRRAAFYAPIALSVLALAAACAGQLGSDGQLREASEVAGEAEGSVMVGGYAPGDASTPGASVAYDMALEAIYAAYPTRALVDEVSMETQVVAGLNYRFRIEMTGAPESRSIYSVTVYRNLEDSYEVTDLTKLQ